MIMRIGTEDRKMEEAHLLVSQQRANGFMRGPIINLMFSSTIVDTIRMKRGEWRIEANENEEVNIIVLPSG